MNAKAKLIADLANVVGRHADWIDGRTWQDACSEVAAAYFEASDLREMVDAEALLTGLREAMEKQDWILPPKDSPGSHHASKREMHDRA